jgi:uncharacterized protein (DUF1499 family)
MMHWIKRIMIGLLILVVLLVLAGTGLFYKLAADSRNMTVELGLQEGRLMPCLSSPNCVSSDEDPLDSHYIAPIADPDGSRWNALVDTIGRMEGAMLVSSESAYARFTFVTPLMGFMDDVEFHQRPEQGEIAVRSASRVGQGDLNANRNRVEAIRNALESL